MKFIFKINHNMKKVWISLFALAWCFFCIAQSATPVDSSKYPRLSTFTAQQDQANMMQQLGIKKLRPGASPNQSEPNHANEDEQLANPCPQLPDPFVTKAGKKITTT